MPVTAALRRQNQEDPAEASLDRIGRPCLKTKTMQRRRNLSSVCPDDNLLCRFLPALGGKRTVAILLLLTLETSVQNILPGLFLWCEGHVRDETS